MEESEDDREGEDLEEDEEGVGLRAGEEGERQERRDAAVQDGGTHLRHAGERALLAGAWQRRRAVRLGAGHYVTD